MCWCGVVITCGSGPPVIHRCESERSVNYWSATAVVMTSTITDPSQALASFMVAGFVHAGDVAHNVFKVFLDERLLALPTRVRFYARIRLISKQGGAHMVTDVALRSQKTLFQSMGEFLIRY